VLPDELQSESLPGSQNCRRSCHYLSPVIRPGGPKRGDLMSCSTSEPITNEDLERDWEKHGEEYPCPGPQGPSSDSPPPPDGDKPVEPPKSLKQRCLDKADQVGLFSDQMAIVCNSPNEFSIPCLDACGSTGMFREHIVSLCTRPNSITSECIRDARKRGMFREEDVVTLCR